MDFRKWFIQEDCEQYIADSLGKEEWLTVYEHIKRTVNDCIEDSFIWGFLINPDSIEEELENTGFNQPDHGPCCEGGWGTEFRYLPFGYEDRQAIVIRRDFLGVKPKFLEVSREFILFHNLYEEPNSGHFFKVHEDASLEQVIQYSENQIRIKTKYLRQFMAFKSMSFVIGIVHQRFSEKLPDDVEATNRHPYLSKKTNEIHYSIWIQDVSLAKRFMSEVFGKKILHPMSLENTGIWPFEKEKQYETFPIGIDDEGEVIEFSCDPNFLANNFGKNVGNPHYLTPVFFTKSVLKKYYDRSDIYTVSDGYLSGAMIDLRMDNNQQDVVMVYLGDLASMPYKEQKYWKLYLTPDEGEISKTAFERSVLGEFSDPISEDLVFKMLYEGLIGNFNKESGWQILKPLTAEDEHHYKSLRMLIDDNQQEFDQQIQSLTKLIIDSINEKALRTWLLENGCEKNDLKGLRGIKKLELFCAKKNLESFEEHITFLVKLHDLRSMGSAHRKSNESYHQISEYFHMTTLGFKESFRRILEKANNFLEYFGNVISE